MKKLKCKIKELARIGAEAKRNRAKWAQHELEWWIENLTVSKSRGMQRTCLLAYAFLQGRPYKSVEFKVKTVPKCSDIADHIIEYRRPLEQVTLSVRMEQMKEVGKWIKGKNAS
jgi:hypothetical protein